MINFSRKESVAQNGEDFEFLYSHFIVSLLRSWQNIYNFIFSTTLMSTCLIFPRNRTCQICGIETWKNSLTSMRRILTNFNYCWEYVLRAIKNGLCQIFVTKNLISFYRYTWRLGACKLNFITRRKRKI